jgi:apolipoprotein N-acyltransferase
MKARPYLLAVAAGILIALSLPGADIFPAIAFGFFLLLFSLRGQPPLRSAFLASITGIVTALIFNTWSLEASRQYTGGVSGESVAIYFALCVYHTGSVAE